MTAQTTWTPGLGSSPPINGAALRKARLSRGWTLRQLSLECAAKGTPVDNSNLSKAEKHGRGLGPRSLSVILRALPGLDPAVLIPGIDDELRALLDAVAPGCRQEAQAIA